MALGLTFRVIAKKTMYSRAFLMILTGPQDSMQKKYCRVLKKRAAYVT